MEKTATTICRIRQLHQKENASGKLFGFDLHTV